MVFLPVYDKSDGNKLLTFLTIFWSSASSARNSLWLLVGEGRLNLDGLSSRLSRLSPKVLFLTGDWFTVLDCWDSGLENTGCLKALLDPEMKYKIIWEIYNLSMPIHQSVSSFISFQCYACDPLISILSQLEDIVGKVEHTDNQHCLFFQQCFLQCEHQ